MHEYEKTALSWVTIFTTEAIPKAEEKPLGTGKVSTHEDCMGKTPRFGRLQPAPNVRSVVFLIPAMKKSDMTTTVTPTFLRLSLMTDNFVQS
jgi:hypothetical protein